MLSNLEPVRRYQAELDAARDDAAQTAAALARMTVEVDSFRGLLKTTPPNDNEEARDQQIHARTLASMKQRQAELFQQRQSALERLNHLESERPAMTQALIDYLIRDSVEMDYRAALVEFQEAAARYRLLRDALIAWNPAAAVKPVPGNAWTARGPGDALYQEQRRLADQGIRLPLHPDRPVIGAAPEHNVGPPRGLKHRTFNSAKTGSSPGYAQAEK